MDGMEVDAEDPFTEDPSRVTGELLNELLRSGGTYRGIRYR